jgi:Chain length determinant protein
MELLAPNRTSETRNEDIYRGFSELIELKTENGITYLSIELHDAEIAAQWVNDLTKFTDKNTVAVLVEELKNSIANQTRDIEYTIESKRHMARQRREDQIIRYHEAAKIAEILGIKRRVDATNIIQNTQMNVDIATATTPLYYLGFEALMTEIEILRLRKSDDPFIGNLRDLQENLTLLRSIKFDKEKMKTVHIDQAAFPSNSPIEPNRRRIVSLATVVGLFSGIFLAFFIEFVKNQRKKHSG